jgi:FRG domain
MSVSCMNDFGAPTRKCESWQEVVECLESFPAPETSIDSEGHVSWPSWVFRGLATSKFELEPSIERRGRSMSMRWSGLELLVSDEFKARAGVHLRPSEMPHDELSWLALMQHYSVPTRLLDFTWSPYVAMYFALRQRDHCDAQRHDGRRYVRIWAVDSAAVNRRFEQVADHAVGRDRAGRRSHADLLSYADTARDRIERQISLRSLIETSMHAKDEQRTELERKGAVVGLSPPEFNPRLANQQGYFLLNCAEGLAFQESLEKMMAGESDWYRVYDIAASLGDEIEKRLFQMNIQEQSLFPDLQGLSGFIQQRIRLHWS